MASGTPRSDDGHRAERFPNIAAKLNIDNANHSSNSSTNYQSLNTERNNDKIGSATPTWSKG